MNGLQHTSLVVDMGCRVLCNSVILLKDPQVDIHYAGINVRQASRGLPMNISKACLPVAAFVQAGTFRVLPG